MVLKYLLACEKTYFWHILKKPNLAMENLKKMQSIYTVDLAQDKCKSTLLALKGILLGHVGLGKKRCDLFRAAVKLDPQSSDFHGYLYSSLRRVRRELDYGAAPSDEEIFACKKAYDLLESKTSAVFNRMAMLFEELIQAYNKGKVCSLVKDMTREQMRDELIFFIKTAAELNPKSILTNVKYGDILANFFNKTAAKAQYEHCLKTWPSSSQVLHKVGRFHASLIKNMTYGLELLEKGLAIDPDNFPCLMDFIRFKSRTLGSNGGYNEILSIIDKYIKNFESRPIFTCKLLLLKGAILWNNSKREQALEFWVQAIEIEPEVTEKRFLDNLGGNSVVNLGIDFYEVVDFIKESMTKDRQSFSNFKRYNTLELIREKIMKELEDPRNSKFWKRTTDSRSRTSSTSSNPIDKLSLDFRSMRTPSSTQNSQNKDRNFTDRNETRNVVGRADFDSNWRSSNQGRTLDHEPKVGNNGSQWNSSPNWRSHDGFQNNAGTGSRNYNDQRNGGSTQSTNSGYSYGYRNNSNGRRWQNDDDPSQQSNAYTRTQTNGGESGSSSMRTNTNNQGRGRGYNQTYGSGSGNYRDNNNRYQNNRS